ncbi:hypothetical protein [Prevotella intermedia]|uniref:hypothetical protein n=1 Tax=Prevotella intermedia TaxID=28131 RepID=UPI000E088F3E|nr:hypothetical protein [Prevotella intermedia]SUB96296.1 Uncharacterised protein [Prevotella intermedia]
MKPLAESILASHYTTHRDNGVGLLYASAIRCSRLFKDVRLRILNTSVPLVHLAFSIEKTYECPACISDKRRFRRGILHFSTPLT